LASPGGVSEVGPGWAIVAGSCAGGGVGVVSGIGGAVVAAGAGEGACTCFGWALAAGCGRTTTGTTGALETPDRGVADEVACPEAAWRGSCGTVGA
jgi:hypothetical protein